MSSANLIVRTKYQRCKNLKYSVSKTISYIGDKKKADSSSIDEYNVLKDFMLFTNKESYLHENGECFIWNMNGDIDARQDLKQIKELDKCGTLWSVVISFPSNFAINNGLITKADYYQLTTQIMPNFLTSLGLKLDNVSWYCSLHRNTPHPHIHINFFEHKKTISNPMIPYSSIHNLKSNIANYLIDNERFYRLRDAEFKTITGEVDIKELTKIKNQRLFGDSYRKQLNEMLLNFYSTLPKTGRLQYNSKNILSYKKDLDHMIQFILMHDSIKYSYSKYLNLLEQHQKELKALYGNSKSNHYYENQLNKLYSKIGNAILSNYKIYQSQDVMERERVFLKKHIHELNFKSRNDYAKDQTKTDIAKGLYKICQMADLNYNQTKKVFQRWLFKSNYNYKVDDLIASITTLNNDMNTTEYYTILKKLGYDSKRFGKLKSKHFYQELNYKIFINQATKYLLYELEQEEKKIQNDIEYSLDMEK